LFIVEYYFYWGLGIGDLGFGVWGFGLWGRPPTPKTPHPTQKNQKINFFFNFF